MSGWHRGCVPSRMLRSTPAVSAALALAVVSLTGLGAARAQRGQAFVEQAAAPRTSTSGFPGLFDTEQVARGDLVADLPLLSIDYGVTDNLSVGTYALALLPLLGGKPSVLGKLRYRLYSDGRVVSVLDAMAGYVSLASEGEEATDEMEASAGGVARLGLALLGSNTSVALGARHRLTGTVSAVHVRSNLDSDERGGDVSGAVTAAVVALSYQLTLTRRLTLRLSTIAAPLLTGAIETSSQAIDFEFDGTAGLLDRTVQRVLLGIRLGDYLLNVGALVTGAPRTIPWLSLAKRW